MAAGSWARAVAGASLHDLVRCSSGTLGGADLAILEESQGTTKFKALLQFNHLIIYALTMALVTCGRRIIGGR
jgi:hypothetical protein